MHFDHIESMLRRIITIPFDFEVKIGQMQIEICCIFQLIDSSLFSFSLFSRYFNEKKQPHQMISNCSISSGYMSNLLNLSIILSNAAVLPSKYFIP